MQEDKYIASSNFSDDRFNRIQNLHDELSI